MIIIKRKHASWRVEAGLELKYPRALIIIIIIIIIIITIIIIIVIIIIIIFIG